MSNLLQSLSFAACVKPQVIKDNTGWTVTDIDLRDAHSAAIVVHLGASDIAMAAFKLTEDDDSGFGTVADVSGADFSVSPLTLPSATEDGKFFVIYITEVSKRKRYQRLVVTAGNGTAGTYLTAICIIEPSIAPGTATQAGVAQRAIV